MHSQAISTHCPFSEPLSPPPPAFWLPIHLVPSITPIDADLLERGGLEWLNLIGRMAPGATPAKEYVPLSSAMAVRAGEGELRDVAILMVDLRGFTRLSTELAPDVVMKILQEYQAKVCPLIAQHGGSIDAGQFVMTGTTTGLHAPEPSHTAKADFGALGTVEVVFT